MYVRFCYSRKLPRRRCKTPDHRCIRYLRFRIKTLDIYNVWRCLVLLTCKKDEIGESIQFLVVQQSTAVLYTFSTLIKLVHLSCDTCSHQFSVPKDNA